MTSASCKSCKLDSEEEEQEERERERLHYWRAQIAIVGAGTVKTFIAAFDCASDGATQRGECGPKLVTFKEMQPATMEATAAPGWPIRNFRLNLTLMSDHLNRQILQYFNIL